MGDNDGPNFESTNPFELLGVSPDVGAREVKRAYVRLIKTYRPESHPSEFEKIRSAYEVATEAVEGGYAVELWGGARDGGGEEMPEGAASAPVSMSVEEFVARFPVEDDQSGVSDDAPNEREMPRELEAAFGGEATPEQELLRALEVEVYGRGDCDELVRLLDDERMPELFHELDEAEYLVIDATRLLLWKDRDEGERLARSYGLVSPLQSEEEWDLVGLHAVDEFSSLRARPELDSSALALFGRWLEESVLGNPDELVAAELREDIRVRSELYGEIANAAAGNYPNFAGYWLGMDPLVFEYSVSAIDTLDEEGFELLCSEMEGVNEQIGKKVGWLFYWIGWLVLVRINFLVAIAFAVLWVILELTMDRSSYRSKVQPHLVRIAARTGLGAAHMAAWIATRKKAGRLGDFDVNIVNDHALECVAALTRRLDLGDELD